MPATRLDAADLELMHAARRAVLATIGHAGRPRLVPVVFALDDEGDGLVVYSPLDDKPKSVTDPRDLARVRDVVRDARVALLFDRWDEDWSSLAWVGLEGTANVIEAEGPRAAEHQRAVALLRARYAQYWPGRLDRRPIMRIHVERVRRWSADP